MRCKLLEDSTFTHYQDALDQVSSNEDEGQNALSTIIKDAKLEDSTSIHYLDTNQEFQSNETANNNAPLLFLASLETIAGKSAAAKTLTN
jgi:hypothetical protein